MTDDLLPPSQALSLQDTRLSFDQMIYLWVESKKKRTGSDGTEKMYSYAMQSFRDALALGHLDLDGDPVAIALVAQSWASTPQQEHYKGNQVAQNTFNQRLAIISSFYRFARKRRFLLNENPILMLDRSKVEAYAHAEAMDIQELREALQQIDRKTLSGKRDYALLSVTLQTGRRAAEIASMRWQQLKIKYTRRKTIVVIHFPRLKGGKTRTDELEVETSSVLLDYLHEFYGPQFAQLPPETPVWVSLATNSKGHQLTPRSLEYICKKRLGESRFHMLRSTFAVAMEEAGAKVSDIQDRLAHESLATTGRYLAKLKGAKNSHAGKLEEMFGIRGSMEDDEESD